MLKLDLIEVEDVFVRGKATKEELLAFVRIKKYIEEGQKPTTNIESRAIAFVNEVCEIYDRDQDAITKHNDVFETVKEWRSAKADVS